METCGTRRVPIARAGNSPWRLFEYPHVEQQRTDLYAGSSNGNTNRVRQVLWSGRRVHTIRYVVQTRKPSTNRSLAWRVDSTRRGVRNPIPEKNITQNVDAGTDILLRGTRELQVSTRCSCRIRCWGCSRMKQRGWTRRRGLVTGRGKRGCRRGCPVNI